jgi:DNA-directed RNA polymerase specialized sigma24 family protein
MSSPGEVERAIEELPALQREALVLFEYEDLSPAELAAVVRADSGTVRGRFFWTREKPRMRLDRYFRIGRKTATVKRA